MKPYNGDYKEVFDKFPDYYDMIKLSIMLEDEQIFVLSNRNYTDTINWDESAKNSGRFYLNTSNFYIGGNDFEEFDFNELKHLWNEYYSKDTEYGVTAYIAKKRNLMPLSYCVNVMIESGYDILSWGLEPNPISPYKEIQW